MSPPHPDSHFLGNTTGSSIVNGSDIPTGNHVVDPQQPIVPLPSAEAPSPTTTTSPASGVRPAGASGPSSATTTSTTDKVTLSAILGAGSTGNTGSMSATTAGTPPSAPVPSTPSTTANNNNNNGSGAVKSCAGCGARIVDRFLLHAMERYWHTGCLKCSCCQAQLGEIGTSCFTKGGMILCKNDYIRLFGSSGTCAACSQNIPAQEFVMRAQTNVYHVNCFTCVTCHQRLVPGDRYSLVNGSLICEQDYPKVLKGQITPASLRASHKVTNNNTNLNNRNEADLLSYY